MTITLVETVGSASANSFVSVAEADAYLEARLNSSAWTGAEPKKQALIEATRDLCNETYQGYRASATQALAWPRSDAPNPDGETDSVYFETTVIPQRVKDATCELALEFLRAGTTDVASLSSTAGMIEKTTGPLTTKWADPSAIAAGLSRYPRVAALIQPLFGIGSGQVRLTR
jgi:hypothetical protein